MQENTNIEVFDWHRMLYSDDHPMNYMWEVALRTVVMFLFLIIILKFMSKRGVKQMSVFELAILIALGSACGDPMFYSHVPIGWGILILGFVMLMYKLITWFTYRYKFMEVLLEGKPIKLLEDGVIDYDNYKKVKLPSDKFFAELRLKGVDHLGQVSRVYLETSGEISVYLAEDDKVVEGLPIYPELVMHGAKQLATPGRYACINCGTIQNLNSEKDKCMLCDESGWLQPMHKKRVT